MISRFQVTNGPEVTYDDLQSWLWIHFACVVSVGFDDLHVEGSSNIPGFRHLLGDLLAARQDSFVEVDGWQDQ